MSSLYDFKSGTPTQCSRCGCFFNSHRMLNELDTVKCPKCGFLIWQGPQLSTYQKGRERKGLPRLPIVPKREWQKFQVKKRRDLAYKEDEKKKGERT